VVGGRDEVSELDAYTISREPLTLRFEHRVTFRNRNTFGLGIACLGLFALTIAGWLGALEMAHSGWAIAGTILALGGGVLCTWLGAMGIWGREELALRDDRIVVTRTLGPWRRSEELALVKGEHVVVAIDRLQFRGDAKPQEWLTASTDPLPPAMRIAMGYQLPQPVLGAIGDAIVAAAKRAGAATTFERR
jgi:hypothetical protein